MFFTLALIGFCAFIGFIAFVSATVRPLFVAPVMVAIIAGLYASAGMHESILVIALPWIVGHMMREG